MTRLAPAGMVALLAIGACAIAATLAGGCVGALPAGDLGGAGTGGAAPAVRTELVTGLMRAMNVAVDSTSVYWGASGAIAKVPIDGGVPVSLTTARPGPVWVAVDSRNVYWSDTAQINKVSVDGGVATTIATSASMGPPVVRDEELFWVTTTGDVMKAGVDRGAPTVLASAQRATTIAVAGGNVYWTTSPSSASEPGKVMMVPSTGGEPREVSQLGWVPLRIVASASDVYVVTNDGIIMKLAGEGRPPEPLPGDSRVGESIQSIAADTTGVYWATSAGAVLANDLAGTTRTIAAGETPPIYIALDPTSVYWVTGGETIVRAPK